VHVLRCWEIENYLLHPEAIEHLLADETGRAPREGGEVVEELHEMACRLIAVVAGSLVLGSYGRRQLDIHFGLGESLDAIYRKVRDQVVSEVSEEAADRLDRFIERIAAFGDQGPPRGQAHWLRLLEGKRVVAWLRHYYRLARDRDVRWHLASLMRDRGKVEEVLDPFLKQLVA
jgi:hypothetical protein